MTIDKAVKTQEILKNAISPEYIEAVNYSMKNISAAFIAFIESPAFIAATQYSIQSISSAIKPMIEVMQSSEYIKSVQLSVQSISSAIRPLIEFMKSSEYIKNAQYSMQSISKILQTYQQINHSINIRDWAQSFVLSPNIEDFCDEDDDLDIITFEEKQEITEAITEIVEKPLNIQQNILKWFEKFKVKNPLITKIFIGILSIIFAIIVKTTADISGEVIKNTILKKEPTQTSQIVTNVNINQSVIIIYRVPYYYEISFNNEQTGETIRGWISKKSIKLSDYKEKLIEDVEEEIITSENDNPE